MAVNRMIRTGALLMLCIFLLSVNILPPETIRVDQSATNLARLITTLQDLNGNDELATVTDFGSSFRKILNSMQALAGFDVLLVYDGSADQEPVSTLLLVSKSSSFLTSSTVIRLPALGDADLAGYYSKEYDSPPIRPDTPPPLAV